MISSAFLYIISCLLYSVAFLFATYFVVRQFWETRAQRELGYDEDPGREAVCGDTSRIKPVSSEDDWTEKLKSAVIEPGEVPAKHSAPAAHSPVTAAPKAAIPILKAETDSKSGADIPKAVPADAESGADGSQTKHDDSKETGQWFVENREILARLHNHLAGHHSSRQQRREKKPSRSKRKKSGNAKKPSILVKHSSTANRIKEDRDRARRKAQMAEEKGGDENQPRASSARRRPNVLERHSSMNEKVTPKPPEDEAAAADSEASSEEKKRPSLLVKHSSMQEKLRHDLDSVSKERAVKNDTESS